MVKYVYCIGAVYWRAFKHNKEADNRIARNVDWKRSLVARF